MKSTIRRILVPLDPSVFAEAALESACFLAKAHNAAVSSVAVLDSDEIRASLIPAIGPYYPLMVEEMQKKIAHADHVLRDCLQRAADYCATAGVEHRESEYEGIPAEKLMASSIFHDLVVAGLETAFHFETRGDRGDSLHRLLDYTSTPVVAVPATGMKKLERAVVAFDGSTGSARALHDFMRLAAPFDPEIVVVAAEKTAEQSDFLLGNAELLLRDHGFEKVVREAAPEPVTEAFERILDEKPADLVVLGMRSRNVLRDFFIGNFTKTMIERGDVSLFLSH
jgi:nucleotide-binding universal stress UspA family protein